MADISIILTAHREGIIAGVTARSALAAAEYAEAHAKLTCEYIVVLDRCNNATRSILQSHFKDIGRVIEVDEGDPGQSRNRGIEQASAPYVAFLDGDDLWSHNWLAEAWRFVQGRQDVVAHSHCNIVFGEEKNVWWHIDSEGALFDPTYLIWSNYWDAMAFAPTEIYRRFPFKKNDLQLGFGHEDWHWNVYTLANGIQHKPVNGTIHYKRRRSGSQMARVHQTGSIVWPLELT